MVRAVVANRRAVVLHVDLACVALALVGDVVTQKHEQFVDHVPVLLVLCLLHCVVHVHHFRKYLHEQLPILGAPIERTALVSSLQHLRGREAFKEHCTNVLEEGVRWHVCSDAA